MSNRKFTGRGVFGKGYYIALVLCAAAIGISGYVYYRNANQTEETLRRPDATAASVTEQTRQKDVPAVATQPQPAVSEKETPTETTVPRTVLKTGAPVTGETVAEYAMDCLSYNVTTRDWRVHDGVDYAAEAGTTVSAAAEGKVYTTYEDDTMGTTVVIRHTGGYTTCYSSLAPELQVRPGDTVQLGQAIGCVGTTALMENALGPHVHFSVSYREEPMDPMEFISLGS